MSADGFIIPALPDMFSLYGIRNIGKSLTVWKKELDTIFALISDEKRKLFPKEPVQFLGYTIYNAKRGKSKILIHGGWLKLIIIMQCRYQMPLLRIYLGN